MAQKKIGCLKLVRRFLAAVKRRFPIEQAYLFGSHVRGEAHRDSDVDLAIISPAFTDMTPIERLVALGKIAWSAKTPEIEAVGYTPLEFNQAAAWDFPAEIRRSGLVIATSARGKASFA